jgi:hypothetical protein
MPQAYDEQQALAAAAAAALNAPVVPAAEVSTASGGPLEHAFDASAPQLTAPCVCSQVIVIDNSSDDEEQQAQLETAPTVVPPAHQEAAAAAAPNAPVVAPAVEVSRLAD